MNHSYFESNEENIFVTLFVGILDLSSGVLDFCNAGHNPPIHIDKGVPIILDTLVNIPLGVFDDYTYASSSCIIETGDMLLLYTDGVTEARDIGRNFYGEVKLIRELSQLIYTTPRDVVDTLVDSVAEFEAGGISHDDKTLMAIKRNLLSLTCTLRNEMESLTEAIETIKSLQQHWNMASIEVMNLRLATEEALVNIISYAYLPGESGVIELIIKREDENVVIEISDQGIAFDPTLWEAVDLSVSIEERKTGGMGIHLLKSLMDEVTYTRRDKYNCLTLKKKITWK